MIAPYRCGGIIDLGDITIRAAAVSTGLIWSGPIMAQVQATIDMLAGRIALPASATLPAWVRAALDAYEGTGIVPDRDGIVVFS